MYSIVIPCFKSSDTIEKVVEKTINEMKRMGRLPLEMILVNDCSPDERKTYGKLKEISQKHSEVKVLDLAKNVGQHNATMAGLKNANGEVIISMDDDMQTRPSELEKMFVEFDAGYDVVYGCYKEKRESAFRLFGSWVNRKCASYCLGMPSHIRSSSFWIMRKYVKDSIITYDGSYSHLLGLILRTTSNITSVEVEHFERESGSSGYTLKSLLALWSNITGFSSKPLHFAMVVGYITSFISFATIIALIIVKIVKPSVTIGWTSTIASIYLALGIILIFMGVIGEYIGRMYLKINKQPQYVIREKINFKEDEE